MLLNYVNPIHLKKIINTNFLKLTVSNSKHYYFDFHENDVFIHKYVKDTYHKYSHGKFEIKENNKGSNIINKFDYFSHGVNELCLINKSNYCMLSNCIHHDHYDAKLNKYILTYGPIHIDDKANYLYDNRYLDLHNNKFKLINKNKSINVKLEQSIANQYI